MRQTKPKYPDYTIRQKHGAEPSRCLFCFFTVDRRPDHLIIDWLQNNTESEHFVPEEHIYSCAQVTLWLLLTLHKPAYTSKAEGVENFFIFLSRPCHQQLHNTIIFLAYDVGERAIKLERKQCSGARSR